MKSRILPTADFSSIEKRIVTNYFIPKTKLEPYPRSPSRAKRRAAKGHLQHHREVPCAFVMNGSLMAHPEVWDKMKEMLSRGTLKLPKETLGSQKEDYRIYTKAKRLIDDYR